MRFGLGQLGACEIPAGGPVGNPAGYGAYLQCLSQEAQARQAAVNVAAAAASPKIYGPVNGVMVTAAELEAWKVAERARLDAQGAADLAEARRRFEAAHGAGSTAVLDEPAGGAAGGNTMLLVAGAALAIYLVNRH